MTAGSRATPRSLLVISQVYPPDPAAVGQHCADVAEEMVRRGWRVSVTTAARGYDDPSAVYPRRETRAGVEVRRLPWSSFGKQSIARRLVAQTLFAVQAVARALFASAPDVILASTSPPFAGFFATLLARLRGVRLVWWVMDLNPDQMVAAGRIAPTSLAARVFDWMNRVTLRRADVVIALDDFMRDRVLAKHDVGGRMHVVPPWPTTDDVDFAPNAGGRFRREHGLDEAFVVMYSGNHALQHPLDTLLAAAADLAAEAGLRFVFVGGGAGKAAVDAAVAAGSPAILSLPYQPLESLAESLSAADIHVVTMGDDMVGIIHPCKIYGALAAGRPILFFGPEESHVGRIVRDFGVGWHVRHGDVAGARAAIRAARGMPAEARRALGERARAVAESRFARSRSLGAVCDLVEREPTRTGSRRDG